MSSSIRNPKSAIRNSVHFHVHFSHSAFSTTLIELNAIAPAAYSVCR